eukprot:2722135-Rhodomonas_salina.1
MQVPPLRSRHCRLLCACWYCCRSAVRASISLGADGERTCGGPQIADAMQFLHMANIVHRDLKPSNCLVPPPSLPPPPTLQLLSEAPSPFTLFEEHAIRDKGRGPRVRAQRVHGVHGVYSTGPRVRGLRRLRRLRR